jgi:hypothetical protein
MLTATETTAPTRHEKMYTRPVFIQGIMQHHMRELTAPLTAWVNGVWLVLPVGTIFALHSGGAGGLGGTLLTELEFLAANGQRYRTQQGMSLFIPE